VSVALVQTAAGWERVCDALGEIRACQADTQAFLQEMTAEFDQLGESLASRQRCLQQRAAQQQESRAEAHHEQTDRLFALWEEASRQQGEIRQSQAGVEEQIVRLADVAVELIAVQNEVKAQREKWVQQSAALATLPEAIASAQTPPPSDSQLEELQHQYSELQQERTLLESELESVRSRAAELTDRLTEQKRNAAQQQSHWDEELHRLGLLLETVASRQADAQQLLEQRPATPAATPATTDPVLGSVLAQFELIQQDCARRRQT